MPEKDPESQTTQQDSPGQQVNWEERYKGLSRVLNERDQKLSSMEETLSALEGEKSRLTQEIEQLRGELGTRDGKVSELEGSLKQVQEELQGQIEALSGEKSALQAEVVKFNVIKDYPDLLAIADKIPAVADEDQMRRTAQEFYDGIKSIVSAKREQWKAGIVPPTNPPEQKITKESLWELVDKHAGTPEADKYIEMLVTMED